MATSAEQQSPPLPPPEEYDFPGGSRYTLEAGREARLDRQSRVVVIACGLSEAAGLLAEEFGCRVTAFDVDPARIALARDAAARRGVADLITFDLIDPESADYPERFFDLAMAEAGALTYMGRKESLAFARRVLRPGGYLALSDLIYTKPPPAQVRAVYEGDEEDILSSERYLHLLSEEGFGVIRHELVDQNGWDRYYDTMRARCNEATGLFANPHFCRAMIEEVETYYQRGGRESVGYLVALAKCFG
jgi:SAM-dependent methyltransferase